MSLERNVASLCTYARSIIGAKALLVNALCVCVSVEKLRCHGHQQFTCFHITLASTVSMNQLLLVVDVLLWCSRVCHRTRVLHVLLQSDRGRLGRRGRGPCGEILYFYSFIHIIRVCIYTESESLLINMPVTAPASHFLLPWDVWPTRVLLHIQSHQHCTLALAHSPTLMHTHTHTPRTNKCSHAQSHTHTHTRTQIVPANFNLFVTKFVCISLSLSLDSCSCSPVASTHSHIAHLYPCSSSLRTLVRFLISFETSPTRNTQTPWKSCEC